MPTKAAQTGRKLVIVESPAKSKTIAGYLGDDFDVTASVGHIRDLPQPSELPAELKKSTLGKFAVDIQNDFEPYYVVNPDKKKTVTELKRLLKEADELYLATDGDREGEAIAWHLLQVLKPKVPVHRMTFSEITREAIARALENVREIDIDLVDAQETRRVLDRLYGYEISPVLWRKVARGLSAGRVQSVATRLVVERERERMAFTAADYWDLTARFSPEDSSKGSDFAAKIFTIDGLKVASGKDFDDDGRLSSSAVLLTQTDAEELADSLRKANFSVFSRESKPYRRRPAAPFTTSTLQQEASRKLKMSSRVAMQVAQRLYENGHITYMRTDSTALSTQAVSAARAQAKELYGADSVPSSPRIYANKSANAQEAHEAIRPSGDTFRSPAALAKTLSREELRLYDLIWKRTVASQMVDATGSTATLRLGAMSAEASPREVVFSASGTVITVRGFLAAYEEGTDVESENLEKDQERLPDVVEKDRLGVEDLDAVGHTTTPPARYTEASLVKTLEEKGIGRPSTYAATISTIMDRGYVKMRGNALVPQWIAFSVVRLLEEHFGTYVDYDFTADLEADLDSIARGEVRRNDWLSNFYFGSEGKQGLEPLVNDLGEIDARQINSIPIAPGIVVRVGKFGPYLERVVDQSTGELPDENAAQRANIPEALAPDELDEAKALELLEAAAHGDKVLGQDPETGRDIVAKDGRYGAYVTEMIPEPTQEEIDALPDEYYKNGKLKPKKIVRPKPRTGSLFSSMSLETVTLEQALQLLSLPRVLGVDPSDDAEITVQNGRFGPYLKKGSDSRSIESEEKIFTITLAEALEIYSQPKQRGARKAVPPLAEFGEDPTSGKKIVVKDGRFGPYITDGETNITVPRALSLEELTEERAIELLAEKRAKGPAKKKAPAKKTAAKKPAAKKAAAKKAPAKKPAAKK